MQARPRCIPQLHLLHLIAHFLNLSLDSSLIQSDFCDFLVHIGLVYLPLVVFHSELLKVVNKLLVLLRAVKDVLFGLLLVLRAGLLQLSDLFLHVFQVLVQLIDKLRVFLLLGHDLFGLLFDVISIDGHETLHLLCIVRSLHSVLNGLNKLLYIMFLSFGHNLGLFPLLLKIFDRVFLLFNILLHLLQTFRLHIE